MGSKKLASALELAKHGYRVFPLIQNSKLPAIKDFPHVATTDVIQIQKWWTAYPENNIGISTENLLVVDVDTKDVKKNGLATMEKLNREGKTFPPTTQTTTTTNGAHLFYDTPYPVKNSASKLGPGLDIRGSGGYVVGPGSTINGKAYTSVYRDRPQAPDWLLEASTEARSEAPQAHKKVEGVNEERAKRRALKFLNDIDTITAGQRNDAGYVVAAQLKDLGLDQGDTFLLMMESWKCEPPLALEELEHIVKSAYKYGKDAQGSAAPENMFTPVNEAGSDGGEVHRLEALNKEYALVIIEGKHRILYETTDEEGDFKIELLVEDTFHKIMKKKQKFQPDGQAPIPLSQAWMGFSRQREYKGLVFSPEQKVDPKFYNLWRGFSVEPLASGEEATEIMKRGVSLWMEHLLENICAGNISHSQWVYEWFCHLIQKPWEKPGTTVVLKGGKGVGKNAIFEHVGNLFKPNYLVTADKEKVFGKFNSHMEQLLLLVLDEATWGGDKGDEGKLKSLITDPSMLIEHKGLNAYKMKSRLRLSILSNEDWVIPATEDERRYAVFNVGEGKKQNKLFFGEMEKCMGMGANRYLLSLLKTHDISEFDVRTAPDTEGLAEQKANNRSRVEGWWYDVLINGCVEGISFNAENRWETEIEANLLHKAALAKIKEVWGNANYLPFEKFIKEIKIIIPQLIFKSGTDIKTPSIILPPLSECREMWKKIKRGKTDF